MNNLSNYQYPPPKNWQDFESLCRDLWKEIWDDPNVQKNGRSGQEQHGVDVFGQPQQGKLWVGVQCKGKDNNLGKTVTETELLEEIKKAKNFTPRLSSWILATTAPRDAKIQQKAREITANNKKKKLFSVTVWCWEDILEELVKYPSLIEVHLPHIHNFDEGTIQKIGKIDLITQKISSDLHDQTSSIESISNSFSSPLAELEKRIDAIQNIRAEDILTSEYNLEIDDIRELITEHNYNDAIKAYNRLRKRIWSKASDIVKYRILANLGTAFYNLGKLDEAGPLFIEAYQYNPDDEGALTNLSIAYSFQSDFEKSEEYARKVLEKNPASINGYGILLQIPPYKNSVEKALELVPEHLKKKPLIAFCIGLTAQNGKKYDTALHWFETALKNDTENSADFKANTAIMLMQDLWHIRSPLLFGQVSEDDRQILERSIQLLTEAWEQIKNTDLKTVHPLWLLNLGIAQKLLGNLDQAYKDIKSAYELMPSDPEFVKHFALISIRKEDFPTSIELLEKIKNNRDVPEISSLLADIYNSQGESEKALKILEEFLRWNENEQLNFLCYRVLVDIYLGQNNEKTAQIYMDKLLKEFSNNVSTYTSAARISRKKNNSEEATDLLIKGKNLISHKTHIADLVELGDEFFSHNKFREAAECFEMFTDITQNTRFTLFLLVSYYNAGILSKALNLCRVLRNEQGILLKHTEIEIGILAETNELQKSKKLATKYLKTFPDNLVVKLRLAHLTRLLGDISEFNNLLNEDFDIETDSLENGLTISTFLAENKKVKKSLNLMYELRRKYYGRSEAHGFYISNFLTRDAKTTDFLYSETVTVDFVVCIKRADRKEEWYVIEDRPNADIQKREFHLEHPFVQELLGKKVGDKVQIKKSEHNEEFAEIIEIKSKFVYALHETMQIYETTFPDRKDFQTIHIYKPNTDDKEKEPEIDFEKISKIISSRSNTFQEAMKLYKTSGLTVGVVGNMLGLAAHEAWEALLTNHKGLTFCSNGSQQDLTRNTSILSKVNPPKLVADITSIYLSRLLKIEDEIVRCFGKLLIAPTTLFPLYRKLEDIKKSRKTGLVSLVEQDGVLYRNEYTPNDVENNIRYFEDLIKWIENNCETMPHQNGFNIERNHKEQLIEILMTEFLDTVLIIKDENYLLFSEDERFAGLASIEFKVQRTWMQPILITLKNKGFITEEEYKEKLLTLTLTNLSHIHFDASILLKAVQEANWLPEPKFIQILKRLQGTRAEIGSAIDVAVEFIIGIDSVYGTPKYQKLIGNLLSHLTYGRDKNKTLNLLIQKVVIKLHSVPFMRLRILVAIRKWERNWFMLK